jgi:glycosyltransferase involved in cell wall biosynthesis
VQASVLALGEQPCPFAPVLRQAGYAVHHRPFVPDLGFLLAFARLLRTEGVDVLHLHAERASFWLALAARLAGVPRIVRTVHGNFLFEGWLRRRRGVSRALTRLLGTHQVTISDAVSATERQRFGNPSEVIPNWFDSARLRVADGAARQAARTRLGLAPDDFVLVTVGNCAPVKNHDSLIEALAGLRDDPRWIYLHVGCEQPGEPERALAARLGIAPRVRFFGLLPDVSEVLAAADLYVMPSHREGLGVAALEAIGSGVPTLLGDVPGLRELAAQFPSVRRCAVDASLAAAVREILAGDRDHARQRAANDAAQAHERFGIERGVAAYARAYAGQPQPPTQAGGTGRMAHGTG